MKVALCIRNDGLVKMGGDTLQAMHYSEVLEEHGCDAQIVCSAEEVGVIQPDIVHIFNIDRGIDAWEYSRAAAKMGVPWVISPIHHEASFMRELRRQTGGLEGLMTRVLPEYIAEPIKEVARRVRRREHRLPDLGAVLNGFLDGRRRVLEGAKKVLCLAQGEADSLRRDLGVDIDINIIPNGIDNTIRANLENDSGNKEWDFVCVGRIERRKNQLAIIQAAQRVGKTVLFVGAFNENQKGYVREFQRITRNQKRFGHLLRVDHQDMGKIYRSGGAHILASWAEVLPLVDLEAAACGIPVMTTTRGYSSEYLGEEAVYLDPVVGCQLEEALNGPLPPVIGYKGIKERGLTWGRVVQQVLETYESVSR